MSKPSRTSRTNRRAARPLLKEVQHNLFRLRLQSETERLEAPSEIVKAKREIARIKTILRHREIEQEKSTLAATVTAGKATAKTRSIHPNDRMIKSREKT